MKSKADEMDAKWAIYRRNLGQNRRWDLKLLLKFNFGRWITIWEQSGCWISSLPLRYKSGHRINTGVIWAVRSLWREKGDFSQKIGDLLAFPGHFSLKSPIYP